MNEYIIMATLFPYNLFINTSLIKSHLINATFSQNYFRKLQQHTHTLVINSKFAFFSHKVWLGSENSRFRATCCRSLRLLLNTLVGLGSCCSDCRRHRPRLSRLSCLRHHRCGQHRGCWRLNLFFLRWVRTLQSLFNELIL